MSCLASRILAGSLIRKRTIGISPEMPYFQSPLCPRRFASKTLEAARWAAERFKVWGLDNARLEPFRFGPGWSLEKLTVEMTAPRYMPLI